MCFYVNLLELWPLRILFSRTNKQPRAKAGAECGYWNEKQRELATRWLTSDQHNTPSSKVKLTRQDAAGADDASPPSPPLPARPGRHYGTNLVESFRGGTFGLDAGAGVGACLSGDLTLALGAPDTDKHNQRTLPFGGRTRVWPPAQQQSPQQRRQQHQYHQQADTNHRHSTAIMSEQTLTDTSAEDERRADDAPAARAAVAESGRLSQQRALAEAAQFRIRTARRRHLDFDDEYPLDDTRAPQRSRWSGPFHFIQAADCQFGMIDSYVHHRTEPGWREEIELCEKLVALCNQMAPRPLFMIICGDLVDSLPNSEIGRRQVVDFKRIFAKLDPRIPLVCVCGNHDVGDEPTSETVSDYRRTFGEDYFYFTKNDILFIVINSQFYQNRERVQQEAREQDEWLEGLLTKCRLFKYSIIFEHIPWFLAEAEEDNDYFNIRKEVRLEWLRKFKDAGVTKIMCGHYHRNAGGWFEGMELVVTSAIGAQCGNDKSGVRIVRVLDQSIEHQYYAMQDVPLRIELSQ